MMAALILLINIERILNGQAYISTIKIKLLRFIKLKKLTKTAVIFLEQSTKLIRQDYI